jgi:hypothetical protein
MSAVCDWVFLKEPVSQDNVSPDIGRRIVKEDTEFLYDGQPFTL